MAIYMIDYENVKTGGLNGISRLTEKDRVIIFYSENANRLTFDLHQRLMASPAKIEYREVSVGGHNALDFQLVTYLGYLIASGTDEQYHIISNDRGFEYVVNFWRRENLQIGLFPYLKDPSRPMQRTVRPDAAPSESASSAPEGNSGSKAFREDDGDVVFVDEPENRQPSSAAQPAPAAEAQKPEAIPQKSEPAPLRSDPPKQPEAPAAVRVPKISPSTPVLTEKIAPKGVKPAAEEKRPAPAPSPAYAVPRKPLEEKIAPKNKPAPEAGAKKPLQPKAEPPKAEPPKAEQPKAEQPKPLQPEPEKAPEALSLPSDKPAPVSEPSETPKPRQSGRRSAPKKAAGKTEAVPDASAEKKAVQEKEQPAPKAKQEKPPVDVGGLLRDLLPEGEELEFVKASVDKYKTKQGLNNALVKKFGNQKAGEIYQTLKPALSFSRGR